MYSQFNTKFFFCIFTVFEYEKLERKECYSYDIVSIDSIESGMERCSDDSGCKGILKLDCNATSSLIQLCYAGDSYFSSSYTCVYDKIGIYKSLS